MRILTGADVRQALSMDRAIQTMKAAFAALSGGRATVPPRIHLGVDRHDGITLVMPALVDTPAGEALAVKVVSLFGGNSKLGLPRLQAAVLALDPRTGQVLGLLEGAALTALRTGAASGAATDLLARPDSQSVAILGAGVQGRTQLEAVCTVRPIQTAWVYDVLPEKADALAAELAGRGPIPRDIRRARSAGEAVAQADIVCTATTTREPAFADSDIRPGTHINAVGSYQPEVREIPTETVVRARVFVDRIADALAEAGDLIQPIRQGAIGPDHVAGEVGELVLGRKAGRTGPEQVTLFKSVGVAVQDALAAQAALERAGQLGIGLELDWTS